MMKMEELIAICNNLIQGSKLVSLFKHGEVRDIWYYNWPRTIARMTASGGFAAAVRRSRQAWVPTLLRATSIGGAGAEISQFLNKV